MALKKDKQKVLGEVFDDERVRGFLNGAPPEGMSQDFYLLERAYRSMNIDNFRTFVGFFKDAGHELTATNNNGHTLADLIATHRNGGEYLQAITP